MSHAEKPYDAEVEFVTEYVQTGARVLVVGCGTGEHSRRLADRGFEVVGVDPSEAMLERARKKSGATFLVGSLPQLPVDGRFDLVFAPFTVVNHLEPGTVEASLEALADRLAPGGTLVLDTVSMPVDGSDVALQAHDRPDGSYARLFQVHDRGEGRYRWDSLVFTPEGWFVDVHDLIDVPADAIAQTLEERGFEAEIAEGYGEAETGPATVVVANYGKS